MMNDDGYFLDEPTEYEAALEYRREQEPGAIIAEREEARRAFVRCAERESMHHTSKGTYYASASDAAQQQRWIDEKTARMAARLLRVAKRIAGEQDDTSRVA